MIKIYLVNIAIKIAKFLVPVYAFEAY